MTAETATQSIYGLVFGLDNPTISVNSSFYVFWVDQTGGEFMLQKYDQGWTTLTDVSGDGWVPLRPSPTAAPTSSKCGAKDR
ncbi:MAG: hypothetical protein R2873_24765 [Caldilineaceae bacterium]